MEKNKGEVRLIEKFGFLGFSTATNIVFNFKSVYYLSFLTMVLHIDAGIAATMLGIGTVWDAINDPLIALFCTNHKFKSGEKVRPYALYACIPWALTVVLMFVNFQISQNWMVVIGLLIYFAYEALYTFVCMPYNSMAALSTKNDAERKSINGFRSLGGCFGSAIGALAILPLIKLFGGLRDHDKINASDSMPLFYTAICMGVLCIIGSLFHYFTSKERVKSVDEEKANEKINLLQAYKMLFKCKSWVYNMFYILGYGITTAIVMNNINYYAAYILGSSMAALPIQAAYLVAAILLSIFTPMIDKRIGRRNTMLLGLAIMIVGKIPFIIFPTNIICIIINALTVGIGATITFVLFNTNRNSITDLVEVQNGRRIDTLISGGDNLIAKLGEALAITTMGWIYDACGFIKDADFQNATTNDAICTFLGWVPLIICIIMAFFAFKIDIKKEMEESLAKRNNSNEA